MTLGTRGSAILVGLGVFLVTLAGFPARATHGAQTSADEPQYLLTGGRDRGTILVAGGG